MDQYRKIAEARYGLYSSTLHRSTFRLLEIGCGAGGLGQNYQQQGVAYHGIDIDIRVVEAAQRFGVQNVQRCDFMEFPDNVSFDVIVFSQVLEHIKVPNEFLQKVHSLLAPSGIVHFDVPNHYSLPALAYRTPVSRNRWGAITYPYHLFAYTKKALFRACRDLFAVDVFDATTTDPLWGQVTDTDGALARLNPLLKAVHAGSLLVVYGVKK